MSKVHRTHIVVEFGDCDPADIVFYPNYFRWFDAATRRMFDAVGMSWSSLRSDHGLIGVPLVDVQARFLRPSTFGDAIEIETRVSAFSSKTMTIEHRAMRDGVLLLEGREVRAFGEPHPDDPKRLRARVIDESIKARFI